MLRESAVSKPTLEQLTQWYEQHTKSQRFHEDVEHFISLLRVMLMERQVYASSEDFHATMQKLITDFEMIADNQARAGQPLFKGLVVGLRSGFGSTSSLANSLEAEAAEVRKNFG